MIAVSSASSAKPSRLETPSVSHAPTQASACVVGRTSACQGCLANCPVRVSVSSNGEGEGIVVEGNPLAGSTQGTTCSNVALAIEQREDPDRLLYPLRRTNQRKGRHELPCFERITSGEALSAIADRLMELRRHGQGHWAYGRLAAKDFDRGIARGGNNNEIIPAVYERASGATARHGGLVRISVRKLAR